MIVDKFCLVVCLLYIYMYISIGLYVLCFFFLVYTQFTRYLHTYDPDAGIKVIPCHRYSTESCGAKIIVTKEWYPCICFFSVYTLNL